MEYRKLYLGTETPGEKYFAKHYNRGQLIYEYVEVYLQKVPTDVCVLEVGCSSGETLKFFREKACAVCGVDLDKERISYGREERGLYYGTLAEVPFDREPDLVIYSQTLEHLLDPVEELKAVSSILGKGLVFVGVPGIKCLAQTHFMDFLRLLQNAHTYHFTLTTLKNVMRIGGFSMVRGDERIWSIFGRSTETDPREYESDYEEVMAFLRRMERLQRLVPFKDELQTIGKGLLSVLPRLVKWI
jgi:SAM-dependent methyltransferase